MGINLEQSSYKNLRNIISERTKSVIFWVGSGISAQYGLPTWNNLKKELFKEFDAKILEADESYKKRLEKSKKSILSETNNWITFERLKKTIGKTTYTRTIKQQLSAISEDSDLYEKIWSLGLFGLINSNIDKLASIGFNTQFPKKTLTKFSGKYISDYMHTLNSPNKFLLNIHGDYENVNSWVFTHKELNTLMSLDSYKKFINSAIISNTIVFIGISADDLSAGGHIEKLTKEGYNLSSHFWITDRCDEETDIWAEESGIQLIKYKSTKNHAELYDLLTDLGDYIPKEDTAPIVYSKPKHTISRNLPSESELLKEEAEMIRLILNDEAYKIFNSGKKDPYKEFSKFVSEYDEALYQSWYTSTKTPNNILLGYTLLEEIHSGMFGIVFKAKDKYDNLLAIKLLQNSVRKKEEYLQGFRRGIKSMKILNNHNIKGMVKIVNASEIPALIVMDWIQGSNLSEIVESNQIDSSLGFLVLFQKLTLIINTAHSLPERVLHRDIRPSNIMIGWDDGKINLDDIHVLDFDLAWYKTSIESKEVSFNTGNGYLAPEQISNIHKVSTRSAAVDSFGIGMTMYYVLSKTDPLPSQHLHYTWEQQLNDISSKFFTDSKWQSLTKRISRLIKNCTKDIQSERWDFSQIIYELDRLSIASHKPSKVLSCDLIAEEVVARSKYYDQYFWNEDKLQAEITPSQGFSIIVKSNESCRSIDYTIRWIRTNKKLSRKSKPSFDSFIEKLVSKNFTILSKDFNSDEFCIFCRARASDITKKYSQYSKLVSTITTHINIL